MLLHEGLHIRSLGTFQLRGLLGQLPQQRRLAHLTVIRPPRPLKVGIGRRPRRSRAWLRGRGLRLRRLGGRVSLRHDIRWRRLRGLDHMEAADHCASLTEGDGLGLGRLDQCDQITIR